MIIYYIYKGDKPRVAQVNQSSKRITILELTVNLQEFRNFNTFCKDIGKLMIQVEKLFSKIDNVEVLRPKKAFAGSDL